MKTLSAIFVDVQNSFSELCEIVQTRMEEEVKEHGFEISEEMMIGGNGFSNDVCDLIKIRQLISHAMGKLDVMAVNESNKLEDK